MPRPRTASWAKFRSSLRGWIANLSSHAEYSALAVLPGKEEKRRG
jgi:hypothetical protein